MKKRPRIKPKPVGSSRDTKKALTDMSNKALTEFLIKEKDNSPRFKK